MIKTQVLLRAHSMRKRKRSEQQHFGIVNPAKDSLQLTGPQIINRVQQWSIMEASHLPLCISGESHRLCWQLPSTVLQQNLIKEFLVSYFYQWVGTGPVLANQNCTAISSFVSLLTNQSISTTTSKNTQFQPIRTVSYGQIRPCKFDFSFASKWTNQGLGQHFLCKEGPPFVFRECTFSSHWRLHLLSLQTVHLNKMFPFTSPQMGDCWHWIGGSKLLMTVQCVWQQNHLLRSTDTPIISYNYLSY